MLRRRQLPMPLVAAQRSTHHTGGQLAANGHRLDELPQLILNCWRGEMSLIGRRRRARTEEELGAFAIPHYQASGSWALPGLSGWAQ